MQKDTGFGLPDRLGTFKRRSWLEYKDKTLGCCVRLVDDDAQARADVFVYPCPLPIGTGTDIQKALKDELGRSIRGVYAVQERGGYSEVKAQSPTMDEVMLLPTGSLPLIGAVVTMKILEKTITGDDREAITSWHGITIFKGKFIKVRYSFPTSKKEEGEKTLNEFITAWKWCLREPAFRVETLPKIRTYLTDPLSKASEEAAAGVLMYAEKSPFTSITIGGRLNDILGAATEASKGTELDMIRAFLVGSIDACLRNDTASEPEAGAAELVQVYRLMQKQHPNYQIRVIEELAGAVKQKKATAWLELPVKKF